MALASTSTMATTLGPIRNAVFIGKPFAANIQVGDSDQGLSCISVALTYGDTPVHGVQYTLQNKQLRVRSDRPIDEPLLTLSVTADCANPITRSYTIFPEMPIVGSSSKLQANEASDDNNTGQQARSSSNQNFFGIESSPNSDYIQVQSLATAERKPPKKNRAANTNPDRLAGLRITPESSSLPAVAPSAPGQLSNLISGGATERPRLELDDLSWVNRDLGLRPSVEMLSTPSMDPAARQHAREQWASIRAQVMGDSQEQQATLEQVAKLNAQLHDKDQEIQRLKTQLTQQEALQKRIGHWLLYGLLGLLGLGLLVFLGSRRLRSTKEKNTEQKTGASPWWQHHGDAQESQDTPIKDEPELRYRSKVTPRASNSMLGYLEELPVPDVQFGDTGLGDFPEFATDSLPAKSTHKDPDAQPAKQASSPAQHSIALLQDVQQQADFSVALGEYDKAEGLLRQFIDAHPATSPLAYLNLLAIYHAGGNQQDFESLRKHFNATFNAEVPEFGQFKSDTRHLEDYSATVDQIQRLWGSSLVIPHIEDLLFRPADGAQGAQAFSPLAYRELLLLYGIATETSATAEDFLRMQGIAAHAGKWLQPNTVFLGERVSDEAPPNISPSSDSIGFALDLGSASPPTIQTDEETEQGDKESKPAPASFDLDFDLDAPVELDLPLPDDGDEAKHLNPAGMDLDFDISDSIPLEKAERGGALDFELSDAAQNLEDGTLDISLDAIEQSPLAPPSKGKGASSQSPKGTF